MIARARPPARKAPSRPKVDDPEAPRYALIPGVDPYIDWVLGPGRRYYFRPGRQQERLAVLIRLSGISVSDFANGRGFAEAGAANTRWRASVHVPLLYTEDSQDDSKQETTCPALVTTGFFDMLQDRKSRLRRFVVRVTLSLPLDSAALPAPKHDVAKRSS